MNEKADVFNYGNLLYVLLTGKHLSEDPRNHEVKYGLDLYLPRAKYYGTEALFEDLIHQCRAENSRDRPTMSHIIERIRQEQVKRAITP